MKKEFTEEEKAAFKAARATKTAELKADLDQAMRTLADQMNHGASEHFKEYLKFCASLYTYSARNAKLIEMQARRRGLAVNHVLSFRGWLKHGYVPRAGEQGLAILVPVPYKKKKKKGDAEEGEEETGITFTTGNVFADTQVRPLKKDGAPVPTFFRPQAGDCDELASRLLDVIRDYGIRIVEEPMSGSKQAYSANKVIGIKPGLNSATKVHNLLHELAHELLHWGPNKIPTQLEECHAESVAFICSHYFGVQDLQSSDYLLTWHVDEKILMSQLEIIRKTAGEIIQKITGVATDDEDKAA